MEMLDIADFHSLVTSKAPMAPIPEVEAAIRKAAATLCKRLKLWMQDEEFAVTEPGEEVLYTDQDSRIHAIDAPRFDGMPVTFATPRQMDMLRPQWQDMDAGLARYVVQMTPNTFRIVPAATGVLKARLVLYPSPDCIQLPAFLLTDYNDVMGDGAPGALLSESTNPEFSNPALGMSLVQKFNAELDARDANSLRPQIRAPLRAKPNFF